MSEPEYSRETCRGCEVELCPHVQHSDDGLAFYPDEVCVGFVPSLQCRQVRAAEEIRTILSDLRITIGGIAQSMVRIARDLQDIAHDHPSNP